MKKHLILFSLGLLVLKLSAQDQIINGAIFKQDGNVGIGLVNPQSKLHLASGLGLNNVEASTISFGTDVTSRTSKISGWRFSNSSEMGLLFRVYNSSQVDAMIIDYKGSVGIGTTTPNTQLVVGNNFGASISGTSGGNAVFGSNLAIVNGGPNHNDLVTPNSHSSNYGFSGMRSSWGKLYFYTGAGNTTAGQVVEPTARMFISGYGNVGIGTTTPDEKLSVNGNIHTKEVRVDLIGWSDFVFKDDYSLPTLQEVESHIKEKGHLKDIPSAKEVAENGILLGDMDSKLLQKIEELVLYTIEQEKSLEQKKEKIKYLEDKLESQEARIQKIEKMLTSLK